MSGKKIARPAECAMSGVWKIRRLNYIRSFRQITGSQSASHLAYFTGKVMRMVVPEPICDLIRTLP